MNNINGKWKLVKYDQDTFKKILKHLDYNYMSIKYALSHGIKMKIEYKEGHLHVFGNSFLYNKEKIYNLDGLPIEYRDSSANDIIEFSTLDTGKNEIFIQVINKKNSKLVNNYWNMNEINKCIQTIKVIEPTGEVIEGVFEYHRYKDLNGNLIE